MASACKSFDDENQSAAATLLAVASLDRDRLGYAVNTDPPRSNAPVVGITGWKNSGKTTLVVALVAELVRRGIRVSTMKHAHHAFDIDREGKDSYKHRQAGAGEVLVTSNERWALMHELRGSAAPTFDELASHLAPCDIVLAEGFKTGQHSKIEVARDASRPLIAASDPTVVAVVTNDATIHCDRPIFRTDDISAIADFILSSVLRSPEGN